MVLIRCDRLRVVLAWVCGLAHQVVVALDPDDDDLAVANGAAVSVAIIFGLSGGLLLLLYLLLKVIFWGLGVSKVSMYTGAKRRPLCCTAVSSISTQLVVTNNADCVCCCMWRKRMHTRLTSFPAGSAPKP